MLGPHVQRIAGTRPTQPTLQIDPMFVQCVVTSPSSTTFSMSPHSSSLFLASQPALETPDEDETCWNLIPYDVPWGPDYFAYKEGSLPGPEGDCLFLRSPTPVDKRRTVRACEKCRERKAK
ncbi:hypothetical protein BDY19DRAFT_1057083, partial [Irpex rosettiformis]